MTRHMAAYSAERGRKRNQSLRITSSQKTEVYLRFSLAECLLSQNKEADRALDLVEQVRANVNRSSHSKQDRLCLAQCNAIDAWALAACGRREEAETRLQEAFAESDSFSKDDLAGLLNSKGSALQALGDTERSRAAFQQALAVFPTGVVRCSREGNSQGSAKTFTSKSGMAPCSARFRADGSIRLVIL